MKNKINNLILNGKLLYSEEKAQTYYIVYDVVICLAIFQLYYIMKTNNNC